MVEDGNQNGEPEMCSPEPRFRRNAMPPLPTGEGWSWNDRISLAASDDGLPHAFRPGQVLTTGGLAALEIAREESPDASIDEYTIGPSETRQFFRLLHIDDPVLLVAELTAVGMVAQLNHVYFAHSLQGNPVYGNPVYGNPVYGNPVYGNPVYGNPVYGNPVYGNPVYGNPTSGSAASGGGYGASPAVVGFGFPPLPNVPYGTELFGSKAARSVHQQPNRSSALPRAPRSTATAAEIGARIATPAVSGSPHVVILDTGLAAPGKHRPATLGSGIREHSTADVDRPDEDGDGYLDPTAGHGTFIAGLVAQIAPGCDITVHKVLTTFGDGEEWQIAQVLNNLTASLVEPERTIVNLSFGSYVLEVPYLLQLAIARLQSRGVQVVASAGNDAISVPSFPAAFPNVLAVGALSPTGPASFTNYGPWVNACAPGYDLLSTFFVFDGPADTGPSGEDPDSFDGWALWSGTSFAAPVVVGNLARLMLHGEAVNNAEAVHRLIDGFSLTVIPNLGTVVDFL